MGLKLTNNAAALVPGATAYTIGDVVRALKTLGLLAS